MSTNSTESTGGTVSTNSTESTEGTVSTNSTESTEGAPSGGSYREHRLAWLAERGLHLGDPVCYPYTDWLTGEPRTEIRGRLVMHDGEPWVRLDKAMHVHGRTRRYVGASRGWIKAEEGHDEALE